MASRDTGFRDYYRDMSSRGPTSDRNRDRIRETRAKGKLNRRPRDNFISRGLDDIGGMLPITPMGMVSGLATNIMRNQEMAGQNRDYFGGNWLHSKIPDKVRHSLMTPDSKKFYDKYMNLASLAQGNQEKQKYIDTANTALKNSQITGRMNYGLSQIDPEGEYLNRKGLPSYSQDLFGEGQSRFDMDRFKEAMGMGEGILGAIPAEERHPAVLDNYEKKTFEVPDKSEVIYGGPRPHEGMPYLSDEAAAIQKEFNTNPYFQNLQDPNVVLPFEKDRRGHPHLETYTPDAGPRLGTASPHDFSETIRVDPKYERWLTDTSDGESGLEVDVPLPTQEPPPFNDAGREAGIATLYGKGPKWGKTGRPLEKEFMDYIQRTGDRITYEEFEGAWNRLHALPRGLHFQEPRIGRR